MFQVEYSLIFLAIINVIQISIFNIIYQKVAFFMNNLENHRTYTENENSLAAKIFIFQFVNSFNSLIIIAFVKRYIGLLGGCVKSYAFAKHVTTINYCDEELTNQMVTIMILNFVKSLAEVNIKIKLNFNFR